MIGVSYTVDNFNTVGFLYYSYYCRALVVVLLLLETYSAHIYYIGVLFTLQYFPRGVSGRIVGD